MSKNIMSYPPVERKYVAVRHFIITIGGEKVFNELLTQLGLTRREFALEYGEKLIGDPGMFNKEISSILRSVKHDV